MSDYQQKDGESIRSWYERTTQKARKILIWFSVFAVIGGGVFFAYAPLKLAAFMQTANGAITIPVAGAIWIAAFVYIFLLPNREVGFRSQEAIDDVVKFVKSSVSETMTPAFTQWQRIGAQVEKELEAGLIGEIKSVVSEFRTMMKTMNETAAALRDTAAAMKESAQKVQGDAKSSHEELKKIALEVRKFTESAQPAIEMFKKLEAKLDSEIATGLLDAVRAGMESVQNMTLPSTAVNPAAPVTGPGPAPASAPKKEPDLDRALKMVGKKPATVPAPAAPAEKVAAQPAVSSTGSAPVRVPLAVVQPDGRNV